MKIIGLATIEIRFMANGVEYILTSMDRFNQKWEELPAERMVADMNDYTRMRGYTSFRDASQVHSFWGQSKTHLKGIIDDLVDGMPFVHEDWRRHT